MGKPRGARWGLGLLLSCVLAVAIGLGGAGTARADFWNNAPGTAHWYSYASRKCLSVLTEAATPGFPVDQYACRNAAAQEWGSVRAAQVTDHRADGCHCTYAVSLWPNHNGGSCMAVADRSGANGTPVVMAPCDSQDPTQWWHIGPSTVGRSSAFGANNRWVIQNYGVGKCLDVENGDSSNELPMQLWDCNTTTLNQSWASDSGPKVHFP